MSTAPDAPWLFVLVTDRQPPRFNRLELPEPTEADPTLAYLRTMDGALLLNRAGALRLAGYLNGLVEETRP